MRTIQAIFENGVFRPTEPTGLPDHAKVTLYLDLQLPAAAEDSAKVGRILEQGGATGD
jgi:predicted DNA-binding antitoxin AbrB/MazE fold protein